MLDDRVAPPQRPARCPNCGHVGAIAGFPRTNRPVRCIACGFKCRIRNIIGRRPCPVSRPSRETEAKRAAAAEIIERCGDDPLNDRLDNLFETSDPHE
jgi:hypothetical protein